MVLVHGWNSHPGIWRRLVSRLEQASLPSWPFDHSAMAGGDLIERAGALGAYVDEMRSRTGYDGPIDVVCHSIGACIARQWLEVTDGAARRERIRQLVMLGPSNGGATLAELFSDPECGPKLADRLAGIFVPPAFNPHADPLVQDLRPGSQAMGILRSAGIRGDITYRVIVTANPEAIVSFFPRFGGKTWESSGDGRYRQTLNGDGIIANSESVLPGVPLEILVPGPDGDQRLPPYLFSHILLPRNPTVIDRVMGGLTPRDP